MMVEMRRETPSFMVGFIADQRALGENVKHWTLFMDQPTSFFAGGETIGDRVGAAYVYLDIKRPRRGFYEITFRPIVVDPSDKEPFPYTRQYFTMLQQSIYEAPAYWLWSHNRWKKRTNKDLK